MEDQGQLGYEDELLCLITGRGGHMSDVPIEAFLGEAGILAGDTVTMTANRDSGVVTIAAPAVAAKMQNDAVILELARRLTLCDKSLVGQYIMAEVENDRYDGEIIEVGYNWWRAQETSCEVKRQSLCLLHPDLILAIGQNENEARGIFDARKAALQSGANNIFCVCGNQLWLEHLTDPDAEPRTEEPDDDQPGDDKAAPPYDPDEYLKNER